MKIIDVRTDHSNFISNIYFYVTSNVDAGEGEGVGWVYVSEDRIQDEHQTPYNAYYFPFNVVYFLVLDLIKCTSCAHILYKLLFEESY